MGAGLQHLDGGISGEGWLADNVVTPVLAAGRHSAVEEAPMGWFRRKVHVTLIDDALVWIAREVDLDLIHWCRCRRASWDAPLFRHMLLGTDDETGVEPGPTAAGD